MGKIPNLQRKIPIMLGLFALLFMPVYVSAQSPDRITILDNFGEFANGEPLFVYGKIASLVDDSFLIMQIHNPRGDLCQIQQLVPLPNGDFITDIIPLKGRICGIPGEYEVQLFYGDYTKSTNFSISSEIYSQTTEAEMISAALDLISRSTIEDPTEVPPPFSTQPTADLAQLKSDYVALWSQFPTEDLIIEIDPLIRPAVSSSLNAVQTLFNDGEITFETAKSIDEVIYTAAFYYAIGDKTAAVDLLADAFTNVKNVTPEKITKRTPTFDELESTLLSLMKKSDTVMSKVVKYEIGFIFARGIAPLYTDELGELVDLLTKARYLDVVSGKPSDLYRLVQSDWETVKSNLMAKESIEELIASSARTIELHQAAILLKELDNVDRFISSDSEENSDLANLIQSDWDALERDLSLATSISDILESEPEINQMVKIIDISSRITKIVEISQNTGTDSVLVSDWESLLDRVDSAESIADVLEVVSAFDQAIIELREKRNPLVILEFEYKSLKEQAELQADYENLILINNALKILKTAENMESGNHSVTRIDRIEVLLSWVSDIAPQIKDDLNAYNKDAYKVRAGGILQRVNSLDNLVELSLTKNRFLPNYIEFTDSLKEKIATARSLVIQNDLDQADDLVSELYDEWTLVSKAYADDPRGSPVGYSKDELKRIDFRIKLDSYSDMVSNFYHSGFSEYNAEYEQKMTEARNFVNLANFVDAESKISEIGDYLSEHLVLNDMNVMFNISFDVEKDIWVIDGATEKSAFDEREDLYVTVFNMDGTTHSSLEFTDTKQGNFFTQWVAPADPGLYVVMLEYRNSQATQIVHVAEDFDLEYDTIDLDMVELSREFSELVSFAERFGGNTYSTNTRFASVINEIEFAIKDKDRKDVNDNLDEFKILIERYLPERSRAAVIEAVYDDERLILSGAVEKSLEFSEDIFVDIYDQGGDLVQTIALKDNSSGLFSEVLTTVFESGIHVAQLQYHDLTVTDFFNVK